MRGDDFGEPRGAGDLVLGRQNLDDIALFEAVVEVAHFAVDFDADDVAADLAMETEGEVERERTAGEVDDVALWSVDENLVGEKIKAEFFQIYLFAFF